MTGPGIDEEDRADMVRLADDQDAALNNLMARHGPKLFHYLIRLLQNEAEAADLAQEAFVRVYLNRAKFDSRQKFSTWLYAIATHLAQDRQRWRARHPTVSLEAENTATENDFKEVLPAPGPTPSESALAEERAGQVRNAVSALPDDLRLPLILAEYEERSQAEIAVILQCSAKAVEMRLYRARQILRQKLSPLLHSHSG